jgi:hypothetical protein
MKLVLNFFQNSLFFAG